MERGLAAVGLPDTPGLYDFVRRAWPVVESAPFVDNWHIGAICEHLEAVTAGQIQKLAINQPPGTSKSLLACVFWPAWEWTRDASVRWFYASYDQRLSTRDSVRCRALVTNQWYQEKWPVLFRQDQDLKTYYETEAGGYRLGTSVGGHGTGEHPDRKVYDDPNDVKGAESEAKRQSVIDWHDLTMPTRGASRGAREVIIQQRLHANDLTGHVLASEGWVHLCLPMRFEADRRCVTPLPWADPRTREGELLCPKQFSEASVLSLEKILLAHGTAGQLQQRPSPRGGDLLKRNWFRVVRAIPRQAQRVRYWDKAASEGKGAYSAGVLMTRTADGLFWVEDVVRGQWSSHARNQEMLRVAASDRAAFGFVQTWVEQEPGSGGKESAEITVRQFAGYSIKVDPVRTDKLTRALPFADQAEAGNVRVLQAEWTEAYLSELAMFPRGKYRDQVDATSGAFNKLCLGSSAAPEIGLPAGHGNVLDTIPKGVFG